MYTSRQMAVEDADIFWSWQCTLALFALFFGTSISASSFFHDFRNKESRLEILCVPASSLEKFAVYFLVYIVGFGLLWFVSVMLCDIIRTIIACSICTNGTYIGVISPMALLTLSPLDIQSEQFGLEAIYSAAILTGAIYALGGILFPKSPFILTTCGLWVLSMLSGVFFWLGSEVWFSGGSIALKTEGDMSTTTLLGIITLICITISIIFYLLSYYRMKEAEVLNKW